MPTPIRLVTEEAILQADVLPDRTFPFFQFLTAVFATDLTSALRLRKGRRKP